MPFYHILCGGSHRISLNNSPATPVDQVNGVTENDNAVNNAELPLPCPNFLKYGLVLKHALRNAKTRLFQHIPTTNLFRHLKIFNPEDG